MAVSVRVVGVLFAIAAIFSISTPMFAHAQTLDELQAQVNALLARLAALRVQLDQLPATSASTPTYTTTTPAPNTVIATTGSVLTGGLQLDRDIGRGDSGADVTKLQIFLARDASIYPNGQSTGFYGPLTEAAVQKFQIACGIVSAGDYASSGYGRIGPKTRLALLNGCGSAPTTGSVGGSLRVNKTTGAAPLTAMITAKVNTIRSCEYGSYALDFGDGSAPLSLIVPAGRCAELEQVVPHVYANPGTYTVSLRVGASYTTSIITVLSGSSNPSSTQPTSGFAACVASGGVVSNATPRTCSVGGVTYTESNTSSALSDSVSAHPASGVVPFDVVFTTRINSRNACTGGEYTIDFGDGQRAPLTYPANACTAITSTLTHRYTTAGAYTVRLYAVPSASVGSTAPAASVNVVASSPTSSAVNPNLVLTPGYDGVFQRVRATFDLADACTAFTFNWGDGSTPASRAQGSGCAATVDRQTLTHTYPTNTTSANYSATLTYGPAGSQSSRSASVTILGSP